MKNAPGNFCQCFRKRFLTSTNGFTDVGLQETSTRGRQTLRFASVAAKIENNGCRKFVSK